MPMNSQDSHGSIFDIRHRAEQSGSFPREKPKAENQRSVLAWRANISQKKVDLRPSSLQDGSSASLRNTQPSKGEGRVKADTNQSMTKFVFRRDLSAGSPRLLTELARKEILDELADLERREARLKAQISQTSHLATYNTGFHGEDTEDALGAALQRFSPRYVERKSDNRGQTPVVHPHIPAIRLRAAHSKRPTRFLLPSFGFAAAASACMILIFFIGVMARAVRVQSDVFARSVQAYEVLGEGARALLDFRVEDAVFNFRSARTRFASAEQSLARMGRGIVAMIAYAPVEHQARSGVHMLAAGIHFASAGELLSKAAGEFATYGDEQASPGVSFSQSVLVASYYVGEAQQQLSQAASELSYVSESDIPEVHRGRFSAMRTQVDSLRNLFEGIFHYSDAMLTFLGHDSPRTYLIVLQNPSEIRPTGGFIGTYGLLKLDRGDIKDLRIDGIYNIDGQLTVNVVPPRPVQYVSTAWSTHDANWFFDFPSSAEKLMWFYEKTGGPTPDGVVALTPRLIERLLELVGPITLPVYGVTLSSENFMDVVQEYVEVKYDRIENRPKQILADAAPILLDRLNKEFSRRPFEIMQIFADVLADKDVMLYSRDENAAQFFAGQGWDGSVTPPLAENIGEVQDTLAVVHTNLGGYKTDRVTRTSVASTTQIAEDGTLTRRVSITRTHEGGSTPYEWYNKPNVDYLRVYAPLGSKLVSAQGVSGEPPIPLFDYGENNFQRDATLEATGLGARKHAESNTDIFQESGFQVFGNWLVVNPGETKTAEFVYTLPWRAPAQASYLFTLFVQPGMNISADIGIEPASPYKISWCSNKESAAEQAHWHMDELRRNVKIGCIIAM